MRSRFLLSVCDEGDVELIVKTEYDVVTPRSSPHALLIHSLWAWHKCISVTVSVNDSVLRHFRLDEPYSLADTQRASVICSKTFYVNHCIM